MSIELLKPEWPATRTVTAFTTTRVDGASEGDYASFNLGSHVGDLPVHVASNRERLVSESGLPASPHWLQQTHSTMVLNLDHSGNTPGDNPPNADGAVTSVPGKVCAVLTADCMPLFLCNRAGTQVGIVHAGWRGMADGIIEEGVYSFADPPEELLAWAGPTISGKHFEVGVEVKQQLGGSECCYRPANDEQHCYANLYALAAERLSGLGVSSYGYSDACTYADQQQFFSHRRLQHEVGGEARTDATRQTGRMASVIYLKN
ncbi:MAG: peptidoglycan editing factor PgeF [Pseudomonadota bacterium]